MQPLLEDSGSKALERVDTDPASAFETAILSPLHTILKDRPGSGATCSSTHWTKR